MHEHDVIVVGAGGGTPGGDRGTGSGADVAIVSKLHPVRSHTGAAEGGINAALRDADSWEDHAYDTMKGSDYLGDAPAVEALCRESPEEVIRLEHWGCPLLPRGRRTRLPATVRRALLPRTTYAGAETGHQMLHDVRAGGQTRDHGIRRVARDGTRRHRRGRPGRPDLPRRRRLRHSERRDQRL